MKFLYLLAVLIISANAYAIVDPEPNKSGLYFDLEADDPCLEDVDPFSLHTMYMIMTNPTFPFVTRLYAGYSTEGAGQITSVMFPDDNPSIQPVGCITLDYLYPIPTTPATVLATFEILYMGMSNESLFAFLHGHDSTLDPRYPCVFLNNTTQVSLIVSAGVDGPTAQINGGCEVVGVDDCSFDGIKAMYR